MAKDDRFTVIVVVLVTLITAGAFLWSHWGLPAISAHSVTAVVSESTVPDPDPVREMSKTEEGNTIVPAIFEVEPKIPEGLLRASNQMVAPDETLATLRNLASGWSDSGVPAAAEVLVRKDRDGRMIVASGTHRRYKALRRQVEALETNRVSLALEQSTETEASGFRDQVIDTLDAVLAIEVPDAEPDMVAGVHAWEFADAEYKGLSRAQRHLLLMGRSNATAVRARLEAIRQSLGPTEAIEVGEPVVPVAEPILIAHASEPEPPLGARVEHLIEP